MAATDRRMLDGVAEPVERLLRESSADPGMPAAAAARWVLTLTDGFHTRGYPEPDRDRAAEAATAKELIARVLRVPSAEAPA